jgi:hypothetical protein
MLDFMRYCDIIGSSVLIQCMEDKIYNLIAPHKQIKSALNKAQAQLDNLIVSDSEQKTKFSQFGLQNKLLRSEIEILKVKVSVVNNKL